MLQQVPLHNLRQPGWQSRRSQSFCSTFRHDSDLPDTNDPQRSSRSATRRAAINSLRYRSESEHEQGDNSDSSATGFPGMTDLSSMSEAQVLSSGGRRGARPKPDVLMGEVLSARPKLYSSTGWQAFVVQRTESSPLSRLSMPDARCLVLRHREGWRC